MKKELKTPRMNSYEKTLREYYLSLKYGRKATISDSKTEAFLSALRKLIELDQENNPKALRA
ncbi:MAG TPA: hypothetical protein PKA63_11420 [Oligoflexia bacterium]|nr:hypothetical protein [Oligoflexia bacterium]HMP49268.1 hypothetical protein [Oligoflexia bacterium]